MEPDYLVTRLALTDAALDFTLGAAHGLLASLAVLALIFASVRTAVMGGREPLSVILRLMLCVGLLAIYRDVFSIMAEASSELSMAIAGKANWDTFFQRWDENLVKLVAASEGDGALDQFMAYLRGRVLGIATIMVTFISFVVGQGIQIAAAALLSILRALGPFMVAAGIFSDGQTIKQWFNAVVQVFCWPIVPPLIMLMLHSSGESGLNNDNSAFAIAQTALFAVLSLSTPLLIAFVFGGCGLTSLAGIVTAAGAGMAMNAAGFVASHIQPMADAARGLGKQALGALDKGAGMAVAHRSAPHIPSLNDVASMSAVTKPAPRPENPDADPGAVTAPHLRAVSQPQPCPAENAPTARGRARWSRIDTAADQPRAGDTLPEPRNTAKGGHNAAQTA